MYYPVVSQCIHTLKLVETWLDKAEQLAASKKFDGKRAHGSSDCVRF